MFETLPKFRFPKRCEAYMNPTKSKQALISPEPERNNRLSLKILPWDLTFSVNSQGVNSVLLNIYNYLLSILYDTPDQYLVLLRAPVRRQKIEKKYAKIFASKSLAVRKCPCYNECILGLNGTRPSRFLPELIGFHVCPQRIASPGPSCRILQ